MARNARRVVRRRVIVDEAPRLPPVRPRTTEEAQLSMLGFDDFPPHVRELLNYGAISVPCNQVVQIVRSFGADSFYRRLNTLTKQVQEKTQTDINSAGAALAKRMNLT